MTAVWDEPSSWMREPRGVKKGELLFLSDRSSRSARMYLKLHDLVLILAVASETTGVWAADMLVLCPGCRIGWIRTSDVKRA